MERASCPVPSLAALEPPSGKQTTRALLAAIAPIAGVVFTAFFVIGLAMPVLPLHVHQGLGMSPFVVGIVAGCQFMASLVSRLWPGESPIFADPNARYYSGLPPRQLGAPAICFLCRSSNVRTSPLQCYSPDAHWLAAGRA